MSEWYALHVSGHYDRWMRRHGLTPFVPTEEKLIYVSRHHTRRKRRVSRPLFPGLAFVNLAEPVRWDKVLAIPFVHRAFSPYGQPYRFRAEDMEIINGIAVAAPKLPYKDGDTVRFVSGPLREMPLTVVSVDFDKGEVRLLSEIMGRVAEISAKASDVRVA